jgi:hypothetical protein
VLRDRVVVLNGPLRISQQYSEWLAPGDWRRAHTIRETALAGDSDTGRCGRSWYQRRIEPERTPPHTALPRSPGPVPGWGSALLLTKLATLMAKSHLLERFPIVRRTAVVELLPTGEADDPYSMDLWTRVLADWDAGVAAKDVAAKFRVSRSWVNRLVQRRESGEVTARKYTVSRSRPWRDRKIACARWSRRSPITPWPSCGTPCTARPAYRRCGGRWIGSTSRLKNGTRGRTAPGRRRR